MSRSTARTTCGSAGPIQVTFIQPPDLVVSAITSPASATSGSKIDVAWTVLNQGQSAGRASGPTSSSSATRRIRRPIRSISDHSSTASGSTPG